MRLETTRSSFSLESRRKGYVIKLRSYHDVIHLYFHISGDHASAADRSGSRDWLCCVSGSWRLCWARLQAHSPLHSRCQLSCPKWYHHHPIGHFKSKLLNIHDTRWVHLHRHCVRDPRTLGRGHPSSEHHGGKSWFCSTWKWICLYLIFQGWIKSPKN